MWKFDQVVVAVLWLNKLPAACCLKCLKPAAGSLCTVHQHLAWGKRSSRNHMGCFKAMVLWICAGPGRFFGSASVRSSSKNNNVPKRTLISWACFWHLYSHEYRKRSKRWQQEQQTSKLNEGVLYPAGRDGAGWLQRKAGWCDKVLWQTFLAPCWPPLQSRSNYTLAPVIVPTPTPPGAQFGKQPKKKVPAKSICMRIFAVCFCLLRRRSVDRTELTPIAWLP